MCVRAVATTDFIHIVKSTIEKCASNDGQDPSDKLATCFLQTPALATSYRLLPYCVTFSPHCDLPGVARSAFVTEDPVKAKKHCTALTTTKFSAKLTELGLKERKTEGRGRGGGKEKK